MTLAKQTRITYFDAVVDSTNFQVAFKDLQAQIPPNILHKFNHDAITCGGDQYCLNKKKYSCKILPFISSIGLSCNVCKDPTLQEALAQIENIEQITGADQRHGGVCIRTLLDEALSIQAEQQMKSAIHQILFSYDFIES